jgi:hypothetical protein
MDLLARRHAGSLNTSRQRVIVDGASRQMSAGGGSGA